MPGNVVQLCWHRFCTDLFSIRCTDQNIDCLFLYLQVHLTLILPAVALTQPGCFFVFLCSFFISQVLNSTIPIFMTLSIKLFLKDDKDDLWIQYFGSPFLPALNLNYCKLACWRSWKLSPSCLHVCLHPANWPVITSQPLSWARNSTHSIEWSWFSWSGIALWHCGTAGWKCDYPVSAGHRD